MSYDSAYGTKVLTITHDPDPKADPKPDPKPQPDPKAEKVPEVESIDVPAALLLACEAISPTKENTRPYLMGVYLHARDGVGRAVGTDGTRMFIGCFPLKGAAPAWLKAGVIVSNDGLKARTSLLLKLENTTSVRLSYAKGAAKLEMSDIARHAAFQVPVVEGTFPDYEALLASVQSFGMMDDDGNITAKEWQTVGINSVFLKSCGEIAKLLDAGLPKENRSKGGMVVRAFSGGAPNAPLVFDFSSWPGALLIVATVPVVQTLSKDTALLLAPAAKLTVAALRAHATRWLQRAEDATTEADKAAAKAKADEFQGRVAAILKTVPGLPAIEAAKAEAGGEPPGAAGPAPTTKRTKIRKSR